MKALTVQPLTAGSARLDDVEEPPESDGAVLVQGLAVGVCGTDMEIGRASCRERVWIPV